MLTYYREHSRPGTVLPTDAVVEVMQASRDHEEMERILTTFTPAQIEDILVRLEDYQEQFDPASAASFIAGIYNVFPLLREERRGMLDFGADIVIGRLALRMIERIESEDQRLHAVEAALRMIEQLSSRLNLLETMGHQPNVGSKQIPADSEKELRSALFAELLQAAPDRLADERSLFWLFYWAEKVVGDAAKARLREVALDDRVFVRVLRSCLDVRMRQSIGQVAVAREYTLPWDELLAFLGADLLKSQVSRIGQDEIVDERDRLALETARRYITGELPSPDWRRDLDASPRSGIAPGPAVTPMLMPLGSDTWIIHPVEDRGSAGQQLPVLAVTCGVTNAGDVTVELHDVVATATVGTPEVTAPPAIPSGESGTIEIAFRFLPALVHGERIEVTVPYRTPTGVEQEPLRFEGRYLPPGRWAVNRL